MRQLTKNGLKWLADHSGYMFKGHLRSVCRQISHPKDQAILAQFLHKMVSMMQRHHYQPIHLILNKNFTGEIRLQSVHRA